MGHQVRPRLWHHQIRQAILTGTLELDEQINSKMIAAELRMSIIPVRELPFEKIRENLLIRSALESLATELAVPQMTEGALGELEELIARMEQCLAEHHTERFGALNRLFHFTLYGVIAEKSLVKLIEQQWDRFRMGPRCLR